MKHIAVLICISIAFMVLQQSSTLISDTDDENLLLLADFMIALIIGILVVIKWRGFRDNKLVVLSFFTLFLSSLVAFTYFLNYKFGDLDISQAKVIGKTISVFPKDKSIRTYILKLDSDRCESYIVSKEEYENLKVNDVVEVSVYDGLFGFPIIVGVQSRKPIDSER
ncbi:MAG: hypothetical protein GC178_01835 [Flavobacteriales bacterium]|nr:hypothetical protein [Flavobacteriales bacterium]